MLKKPNRLQQGIVVQSRPGTGETPFRAGPGPGKLPSGQHRTGDGPAAAPLDPGQEGRACRSSLRSQRTSTTRANTGTPLQGRGRPGGTQGRPGALHPGPVRSMGVHEASGPHARPTRAAEYEHSLGQAERHGRIAAGRSFRFHVDRAAGRADRRRRPRQHAPAGRQSGQGNRPPNYLSQSPAPMGPGHANVRTG